MASQFPAILSQGVALKDYQKLIRIFLTHGPHEMTKKLKRLDCKTWREAKDKPKHANAMEELILDTWYNEAPPELMKRAGAVPYLISDYLKRRQDCKSRKQ